LLFLLVGLFSFFRLDFPNFISECSFGGIRKSAPIRRFVCSTLSRSLVMQTVRFIGRVLPDHVRVTLAKHICVAWGNPEAEIVALTELQITDNIVSVTIQINKFDLQEILRIAVNNAQDLADMAVNLLALKTGDALSVVLDKVILPDGKIAPTHPKELEYTRHMTAVEPQTFEHLVMLAVPDRNLRLALRDLSDGLRQSYTGTIGAARALDGICRAFVPEGGERDEGWAPMRAALNATEPYVKSITAQSRGPRHADWQGGPEPEVRMTTERAWILMNRFLEYRKRGNQPLPLSEFPLLELTQA
jgi:hypothetical protein